MNILLLLIPIALIIVTIACWFFFWAIKSDQFDDLDRQGANILFDEDELIGNKKKSRKLPSELSPSEQAPSKQDKPQ